jgi:hypothetical protein
MGGRDKPGHDDFLVFFSSVQKVLAVYVKIAARQNLPAFRRVMGVWKSKQNGLYRLLYAGIRIALVGARQCASKAGRRPPSHQNGTEN